MPVEIDDHRLVANKKGFSGFAGLDSGGRDVYGAFPMFLSERSSDESNPGFIRARRAGNAVCGLRQNQSLTAIDFAGTSLCRGKV